MALLKIVVWATIFLTKLRFPPGISIATVNSYNVYSVNCIQTNFTAKIETSTNSYNTPKHNTN